MGTDQPPSFHLRIREQSIHQIQRSRVKPLQIVEEERYGMLPREHANKSTEYQLEATLRISRWKFWDRLLLADDELQFGDQIHHELTVRADPLLDCSAPSAH